MNLVVHQSIVIHQLKVGGISNSSVFQIGAAGAISALANLYNTGGFTGPAPQAQGTPLVPLSPPSRMGGDRLPEPQNQVIPGTTPV